MIGKKKNVAAQVVTERNYTTLIAPLITEKATMATQYNQVAFWVDPKATKTEIKSAVENLFKVEVTGVNTIKSHGKVKRFRGQKGVRSDRKKAFVRLKDGQTIDLSTGLPK